MEETSTSAPDSQARSHRTTSGPILLPEPRIPCPPALGILSPHKMCTLRPKAPIIDPVLLGAPRFQVGRGSPKPAQPLAQRTPYSPERAWQRAHKSYVPR